MRITPIAVTLLIAGCAPDVDDLFFTGKWPPIVDAGPGGGTTSSSSSSSSSASSGGDGGGQGGEGGSENEGGFGGDGGQGGTPCAPEPGACGAATCGAATDSCGTDVDCGNCDGGDRCIEGACCAPASCGPGMCGSQSDGCGGTIDCGATCGDGTWMACGASGRCECTSPVGLPGYEHTTRACREPTRAMYCGNEFDEGDDEPSGCIPQGILISGSNALLWCCP